MKRSRGVAEGEQSPTRRLRQVQLSMNSSMSEGGTQFFPNPPAGEFPQTFAGLPPQNPVWELKGLAESGLGQRTEQDVMAGRLECKLAENRIFEQENKRLRAENDGLKRELQDILEGEGAEGLPGDTFTASTAAEQPRQTRLRQGGVTSLFTGPVVRPSRARRRSREQSLEELQERSSRGAGPNTR